MRPSALELQAQRLSTRLPSGPRLAILGSTSFRHPNSQPFCSELGHRLALHPGTVLLTGGMSGVASAVSEAFSQHLADSVPPGHLAHVLPLGYEAPPTGTTHFVGTSLAHRREVLARLAPVYVVVEGGPGTAEEASIAAGRAAKIIPLGSFGGAGSTLYSRGQPDWAPLVLWKQLGDPTANAAQQAAAVAALAFTVLSPAPDA